MEIKILVPENKQKDLENFIASCENQGFKLVNQGGGKLPSFSGYYATLKGNNWKCSHPYDSVSEDSQGFYCMLCKEELKPI